jgi:hypothetical protein
MFGAVIDTPVALLAGVTDVTVGVGPATVVKLQESFAASAVLFVAVTPVVIVAVYGALLVRLAEGVKVAVLFEEL